MRLCGFGSQSVRVWQLDQRAARTTGGSWIKRTGSAHVFAHFSPRCSIPLRPLTDAGCNPSPCQVYASDGQAMDSLGSRCKIVVVGDTQCGKTALLHVFAKDCYPEVGLGEV